MIRKIINNHYFLFPGDMLVTSQPVSITTVLGSCVSVCMADTIHKVAGMNHYLLPVNKGQGNEILKYGDTSLETMLRGMLLLGADMKYLTAHVYGGSSMFSSYQNNFNIGSQNIAVAMEFLQRYNIRIKEHSTGGKVGRKVVFQTSTFVVSNDFTVKN